MAKFVATDYVIEIESTDFSSSIAAATLEISADEQETTAFGADLPDPNLRLERREPHPRFPPGLRSRIG